MKDSAHTPAQHSGFTLIELSIVLVIIGFIVGGVLVGRELIAAATLRKAVSSVEKIKTSVQTFKMKYNALPGDIATFAQLGLPCSSVRNPVLFAASDGNGVIQKRHAGHDDDMLGDEMVIFWMDLKAVGLIADPIDTTTCATDANGMDTDAERAAYLPMIPLSSPNFLTVYNPSNTGRSGQHYFALGYHTTLANTVMAAVYTTPPAEFRMTPFEALQIDTKMDDGNPRGGKVMAIGVQVPNQGVAVVPAANACITSTTTYNTAPSHANTYLCKLEFNAGF